MAHRLNFRLLPWMVILLATSLAALIWSGVKLYQAHNYHQHLSNQSFQTSQAADAVFANATLWAQRGQEQKALTLYAQVATIGDRNLRKAAHYNSANIYLTQATKLLEQEALSSWDRVAPLLALAKESYREALRLDPAWPEAKYNYELALRLAPAIESKTSTRRDEEENEKAEERPSGWPSIPGFPRGMP